MNKLKLICFVLILIAMIPAIKLNGQSTREQYIDTYKELAIREMNRTGIPASIKLAQALLESDNGNSKLARKARNHFGIKCHNWDGKTYHQDDDEKHECFRKYNDVEDSYKDHSAFLQRDRYARCFELNSGDYKGWARELKKAGYATNPRYPQLLIRIIEDNMLYQYDDPEYLASNTEQDKNPDKHDGKTKDTHRSTLNLPKDVQPDDITDEYIIPSKSHEVNLNNRVKYIVCKKGDSFQSINNEFDFMRWQLPKYNELDGKAQLETGQILYIQPKRKKAASGHVYHTVEEGETMYSISQKYAIRLSKLYEYNLMLPGSEPKPGDQLNLRSMK